MIKRLVFATLALLAVVFCGCEAEQVTETDSSVESTEEYGGAVYTARTECEGGYILRDYTAYGLLLEERTYGNNGILKVQSVYGADGHITKQTNYNTKGEVDTETLYTVEGYGIIAETKDKNGNFKSKTRSEYNENDLLKYYAQYDGENKLIEDTNCIYDSNGTCIRIEKCEYFESFPIIMVNRSFDSVSGDLLREEIIQYTEDKVFELHEVYEYGEDTITLVEKYDEAGNPLPIEG